MRTRASRDPSPRATPVSDMQSAQGPGAPADAPDSEPLLHAPSSPDATAALEARLTEKIQASQAALLAQLQTLIAGTTPRDTQQSIPPAQASPAEGGTPAPAPAIDLLDDGSSDPTADYVDFASYGDLIAAGLEQFPRDVTEPRLWTLTDDTARAFQDRKSQAGYDEYLHLACYAFFDSCANAAADEALGALSTGPLTPSQE